MQTEHPTTELYFVFAFTYCKLRVYKTEEVIARTLLKLCQVEMLTGTESTGWSEWDTRILLNKTAQHLPQLLEAEESRTRIKHMVANSM